MRNELCAIQALAVIWAVVLISDGEGEIRLRISGFLRIDSRKLREKYAVIGVFFCR